MIQYLNLNLIKLLNLLLNLRLYQDFLKIIKIRDFLNYLINILRIFILQVTRYIIYKIINIKIKIKNYIN